MVHAELAMQGRNEFSVVSRHLPTSQGLLCELGNRPSLETCADVGASRYPVCLEILVDSQCLGATVDTAHLWSWECLVLAVHDYERKPVLYTKSFWVYAAMLTT